jgi:hypothetical protein
MRHLRGPSLAALIQQMGAMPPQDIRRIMIESAQALGYAHKHGVVHRDVKPDNILFKSSGEVVMCDFGIAKAGSTASLTGTGTALGTPLYMSPEQLRAIPLDGRSDLYSLGVVAYQCLTKSVPFDGEDSFAIGYKHITEAIPTPQLKTPEQRALFRIIRKLMEKEPDDRYQDAESLIADLNRTPQVKAAPARSPAATTEPSSLAVDPTADSNREEVGALKHNRRLFTRPTWATPKTRVKPRRSARLVAVFLFLFLIFGGTGLGGYYYVEVKGEAPPFIDRVPWLDTQFATLLARMDRLPVAEATQPAPNDSVVIDTTAEASTILAATLSGDSAGISDSATIVPDSSTTGSPTDSTAPALVQNEAPGDDTLSTEPSTEPVAPTFGHVVITNTGQRASLWIDGRERRGLRHDLTVGEHTLRVVAPGYEAYTSSIIITAGDTVRHRVSMIAATQCQHFDRPGYNQGNACFDQRPRPARHLSPFVPLDASVRHPPKRPAMLNVQVRADGTPGTIIVNEPSDVPEFALLAVQFARQLTYEPATKNGQPVSAWVQIPFYPER